MKTKTKDVAKVETYPDVFRQFEHAMLDMERRMDHLIKDVFKDGKGWGERSLFHGLALHPGPDGRLRFQPFGNLGQTLEALREGWREPFLTWEVKDERLELHAETPGITKDQLELEVTSDTIYLEAEGQHSKYRARCSPGVELDPTQVKAEYKDGVLRASVALKAAERPAGRKVRID